MFDACVYGERQPDGTQSPASAVALRPGWAISGAELRALLNARLGTREQLTRLDVLEWSEFLIGLTGKTLKRVFRERTEPVRSARHEDTKARRARRFF